ncbi:serine hydrolase domain-containing protein [Kribbella sandramycini]
MPVAALTATQATAAPTTLPTGAARPASGREPAAIGRLFDKVEAAMAASAIPGVGLGVWYRGREYVRGFGVTNVDNPSPVTGDTAFRVGSTSKTFTATAIMRLVERGKINLDHPVRRYLPDFRTADPSVGGRVTVRQLLNHSAGWLGDDFTDKGAGDDALAQYVASLADLPQVTPLGKIFSYNNAAIGVAGRIIEVVTGKTYEAAARELVIDPLGLDHSRFFYSELAGQSVATGHDFVDGKVVAVPAYDQMPRTLNSFGGLISSARDQLRYARYHLGHRALPQLLRDRSRLAMQSNPGPGGTLFVELNGAGIGWMLRPTAEGPIVVQHGGDWTGHHSGFLLVPKRDFAITVLTNSESGPDLVSQLCVDDWALREFAGVSNQRAVVRDIAPHRLAQYEGTYVSGSIGINGQYEEFGFELVADKGQLAAKFEGEVALKLGFYRHDYVKQFLPDGTDLIGRANFVRGSNSQVEFLRFGGRLFRRETAARRSSGVRRDLTKLPQLTRPVR